MGPGHFEKIKEHCLVFPYLFLQILLPPIVATAKQSCIGWKTARLHVLLKLAQHAMERREAKCECKEAAEKKSNS